MISSVCKGQHPSMSAGLDAQLTIYDDRCARITVVHRSQTVKQARTQQPVSSESSLAVREQAYDLY